MRDVPELPFDTSALQAASPFLGTLCRDSRGPSTVDHVPNPSVIRHRARLPRDTLLKPLEARRREAHRIEEFGVDLALGIYVIVQ